MTKFIKKVKTFFIKLNGKDKKVYEIGIAVILLGVIILSVGSSVFEEPKENLIDKKNIEKDETDNKEKRLSSVLSNINGAGNVEVIITYETGPERIYAYETKSNESSNHAQKESETDTESKIAFEEDLNGAKKPVLLKEKEPIPKGAVVIADGAGNPEVRENLRSAMEVLIMLPKHRIKVFEGKK